jgi:hypothetical protein
MADEKDDSPTITVSFKMIGSVVAGVVAILGSIWAIDSHYASAADVQAIQKSFDAQFIKIQQTNDEDKMFELDIKKQTQGGKLDPVDAALYERYLRRLQVNTAQQKKLQLESTPQ